MRALEHALGDLTEESLTDVTSETLGHGPASLPPILSPCHSTEKPPVSVVVTTLNEEADIGRCLTSIRGQTLWPGSR